MARPAAATARKQANTTTDPSNRYGFRDGGRCNRRHELVLIPDDEILPVGRSVCIEIGQTPGRCVRKLVGVHLKACCLCCYAFNDNRPGSRPKFSGDGDALELQFMRHPM